MISGDLCGIEITELVDQEYIARNHKGENMYRFWNDNEIIKAIKKRLMAKNGKSQG
jgi:hypothetical protein